MAPTEEYSLFLSRPITLRAGVTADVGDFHLAKNLQLEAPASGSTITSAIPRFAWKAFPDATEYRIDIANDETGEWAFRGQVPAPNTHVDADVLWPPGRYQWGVQAYNASAI